VTPILSLPVSISSICGERAAALRGRRRVRLWQIVHAGLLPRLEREDRNFSTPPLVRPGMAALSGRTGLAAALERAFEKLRQPRRLDRCPGTR
jgi:hypothetical protein